MIPSFQDIYVVLTLSGCYHILVYGGNTLYSLISLCLQVLVIYEESRSITDELYQGHRLAPIPAIPFYCYLCSAWHAAIRRRV